MGVSTDLICGHEVMMKMGKTVEDRLVKLMMVKMAMNLTDDAEEYVEIHH